MLASLMSTPLRLTMRRRICGDGAVAFTNAVAIPPFTFSQLKYKFKLNCMKFCAYNIGNSTNFRIHHHYYENDDDDDYMFYQLRKKLPSFKSS